MLSSPIDDPVANAIIARLLYLEREDPDKDISLHIQSSGGVIVSSLAIYDTVQIVRAQVSTICIGMSASMASVCLCAGAKGKRYALPHSTIHMHHAIGDAWGQATDIEIAAREILRLQEMLRSIISRHVGQSIEKIAHDTDRDFYLNPQQAVEYGIVDEILTSPENARKEER